MSDILQIAGVVLKVSVVAFMVGKLRVSGPALAALRQSIDQFTDLTGQLSAHSYWVAVAHVKKRISKILHGGAKAKGDVVVTL